eukprot:CAMPEP_0174715062 /NCGR_PEP_ID=MMETSP1094-20130205/20062_1 /TAXON_ID=156173 /ORGANISM="Chrysochromulina brevifilum, Strain UTEX LB 985" /LENGTH=91 /DNA_ID=CAMNT_0015914569 /DNA_START=26 /DNA_END=301 /DNA_ORIENTATION=+
MSPKRPQTPLEREAENVRKAAERRKEAVKAAQQHALRLRLQGGTTNPLSAGPSATARPAAAPAAAPAPPDFDAVRKALHDQKHKKYGAKSG